MTKMKTASENRAELFLTATLMAIRDGNKRVVMGGLVMLFQHLEDGGDLPRTFTTNMLEAGQR